MVKAGQCNCLLSHQNFIFVSVYFLFFSHIGEIRFHEVLERNGTKSAAIHLSL